ncbi:acetylcholinesterase-like isoform X1 [Notechis scutatus]|uniref:Carboxylic ester hydrolase n=1 Tax=Notechis scutatus TaxID=8663 RepID=A0A6J1VM42_9SAUR|nr:acetylcholinesterase-like isoform X1 [Notechis scutatus]XP_026541678.1 acetylcholinesterase-like isoform X1 [Notechis scutatus]
MPVLLPAFLGLCFCQLISGDVSENDTVVVTSSGSIKGMRVLTRSGAVDAYLGIPYAEPPVGKLRFQKPVPHQPWSHVLEATRFGKPCHQWTSYSYPSRIWVANKPHSEDCLFLNIWVPHPQPSVSVPILVWIHGGGFIMGAGSLDLYNGSTLAATENVIVASMNYRLGIWGFLYFPPEAPGNMGLWDQYLALNWLKENAAVFGGDADKLTLIGHSAGAASVGFHLLSPISQSLFDRAVLQSGAPNAPWALMPPEKIQERTINLIHLLNCRKQNDSATMRCLQNKEADVFVKFRFFRFPTYDGHFLPEDPKRLLQKGDIPAKSLLIGITREDGTVFIPQVLNNRNRTWEEALSDIDIILQRQFEKDIVKAIALKYSEVNQRGPNLNRQFLAHFSRDHSFLCPLIEVAARMVAANGSVYVYSFSHQISTSIWQEWMGAAHGVEVPFVFGTLSSLPGLNQSDAEADRVLSQRMMHYWAQFARRIPPNSRPAKFNGHVTMLLNKTSTTSALRHLKSCSFCHLNSAVFWKPMFITQQELMQSKEIRPNQIQPLIRI